jgi:deoxyribonuclease-4
MSTLNPCPNKIQTQKNACLLGVHFSIARGLHNALYEAKGLGCNTLQIFTKNSNTWKERTLTQDEIDNFNTAKEFTEITSIASHTSYLVNLASHEKKKILIK